MANNRETVGKISSELLKKTAVTNDPIEIERAMHEGYVKNILECINDAPNSYGDAYFIVVITKKEPLMPNVLRNYFLARKSCPTPDYDQAVYLYNKILEELTFLWVIPSKDACLYLKDNALSVSEEEKPLLRFVLDFADGTLYKLSKSFEESLCSTTKKN